MQIAQIFVNRHGLPLLGRTVRLVPLRVRIDWFGAFLSVSFSRRILIVVDLGPSIRRRYRISANQTQNADVAFSLFRHQEAERGESADEALNAMYRTVTLSVCLANDTLKILFSLCRAK